MSNYSNIHSHRSMFFDDIRNQYYFDAIKSMVNKESVVLDLGAGLGLFGYMAMLAGAKKVYLVEPAKIMNTTKMIVKENNLADKIVCIEGRIEEIELPEKVDVIISVFTGNFLLSEDLLPSLFYARDKFLKPEGKMIPDRAKMITVPVSASAYYAKHIDCWSHSLEDIDFKLLRKFAVHSIYTDKPKKREATFLSKPSEILELDFMTATKASCKANIEVEVSQDGLLHGWLGWFDARVGDAWFSTSPKAEKMHWGQVFLPIEKPIPVKKGDNVSLALHRPEFGEWSWVVATGGNKQKYSTFLSEPISIKKVLKKSEMYKPVLSEYGEATTKLLTCFDGSKSKTEIIQKAKEDFPLLFKTEQQAEQFVENLIEQYS